MKNTIKLPLGKITVDDTLKNYSGKETDLFIGSNQEKVNEILEKSKEAIEKIMKRT